MLRTLLLLTILGPWAAYAQPAAPGGGSNKAEEAYRVEISGIADSLAATDQLHGPYVGFTGEVTSQYRNFERLAESASPAELLALTRHENAVVRGYAFWALARQGYPDLEAVLLEHARDEARITEIQGGIMQRIPLVDFMQWVADPDLLDGEGRKLDPEVFQRLAEIRFSAED